MNFLVTTHIEAETEAQAQAVRDEMAQGAEDGRDAGEFPHHVVWNVGDLEPDLPPTQEKEQSMQFTEQQVIAALHAEGLSTQRPHASPHDLTYGAVSIPALTAVINRLAGTLVIPDAAAVEIPELPATDPIFADAPKAGRRGSKEAVVTPVVADVSEGGHCD